MFNGNTDQHTFPGDRIPVMSIIEMSLQPFRDLIFVWDQRVVQSVEYVDCQGTLDTVGQLSQLKKVSWVSKGARIDPFWGEKRGNIGT